MVRRLLVLLLVLILICGMASGAELMQRAGRVNRSGEGVKLWCGDGSEPIAVANLSRAEVADMVAQLTEQLSERPIEPVIDPVTRGVIPGLAGRQLDVEATVAAVMAAARDTLVHPVWYPVLPEPLSEYARYPIYQGNPAKQQIALVINVAWGNENLPAMLDILAEANVKASFFLVGRWVANNPDLVQQIADGGHEFGNHAYSDPHLPRLSREAITQEITRTSMAIEEITGQEIRFFSPPYNDFDQNVLDVAADLGYLTVLCSLDTADWMRPGVDRIVSRIVPKAHSGAIVLMHPTEQTPEALRRIIRGLQEQGYQLVTVGELLSPLYESSAINGAE